MKTKVKHEELFSTVIHDLKTPAIAQIKALELFLNSSSGKITTEEKDLIELTLNSCNYMQKLIDNFFFITKLNSDGIKLSYKSFNIAELISKTIAENNILIKYSNLKIKSSLNENISILADKIKIKKVIESFILYTVNNAYKNSDVNIYIKKDKNNFKFEIISNSPHLKQDKINELFEKIQTKYNSSCKNIGLYLSKKIINAHFGKTIFKSLENDVNILGFYLPVK